MTTLDQATSHLTHISTDRALADRQEVLRILSRYLTQAWASFDEPRLAEVATEPDLVQRLGQGLPEAPEDIEAALGDAVSVLEASISPARPLYLGYVGSTGLETGVLASSLMAAYDANLAGAAGAADLLDAQAVKWVAEFIGYPMVEGHFTSGGQTSNLTALLVAREQALPGSREFGTGSAKATVYCSDEAHHSVIRAAEVAGLGRTSVRRIPIDERRRMRVDALREALTQDMAAGRTPVAVIATAGTTLTGAVDPIDEIATVCREANVWLHVDGAYGLAAAGAASARSAFAGLEKADSVTIDAHKWLGMQKSCSLILLRHAGLLAATFGHEEKYMLHEPDVHNPVDSTLEYSRPFRALRVWLSMRVHGAEQFRMWIEHTLENARSFTRLAAAHPDFEVLHEPMLSTVCFRHSPPGLAAQDVDAHNEALARAMQKDGRVHLAPAHIDGMTCLRVCFVNFRTRADSLPIVLGVASQVGDELVRDRRDGAPNTAGSSDL
jgi:aromatic-L-amino-acid/L-tryptophan decarboxylase